MCSKGWKHFPLGVENLQPLQFVTIRASVFPCFKKTRAFVFQKTFPIGGFSGYQNFINFMDIHFLFR
jgi:hypothetical protein